MIAHLRHGTVEICDSHVERLRDLPVGGRVWFEGEKRPYRVRARNVRYLVCTKPFNARRTVIYTVVDLEDGVRGTENLIFGMGAETDEQCEAMVKRLAHEDEEVRTEVSWRNRVALDVVRVEASGSAGRDQ